MGCNATSLLADATQHTTQIHPHYVHAKTSPSKYDLKYSIGKLSAWEAAWENYTGESKQEGKQASQTHDEHHGQGKQSQFRVDGLDHT